VVLIGIDWSRAAGTGPLVRQLVALGQKRCRLSSLPVHAAARTQAPCCLRYMNVLISTVQIPSRPYERHHPAVSGSAMVCPAPVQWTLVRLSQLSWIAVAVVRQDTHDGCIEIVEYLDCGIAENLRPRVVSGPFIFQMMSWGMMSNQMVAPLT
jgi:hypothetical protein